MTPPRRLGAAIVLVTLVFVALATMVAFATPASAHAELERTAPAAGAQLDTAPRAITLAFTERVEVAIGAIRVFDADAERLATSPPRHPRGQRDAVEVALTGALPDGAYVVTWRVTSADGHPVHGAFSFRVGEQRSGVTDERPLIERLLAADRGDAVVGAVFGVARAALFAGVIVSVGATVFVTVLWPAGWTRARRMVIGAGVLAAIATVATLGLQGAYAGGLGLGDALRWSTVSSTLDTRYGTASLARLVLLVLCVPLVATRPLRSAAAKVAAAAAAIALLATIGWAGHAGSGTAVPLAMALDVVHLTAVAAWLGGLVTLAGFVLRGGDVGADPAATVDTVARFSRLVVVALPVIVVTGMAQSARQVGSEAVLTALRETDYGRLLVAKLALFAGLLALGLLSRRWVTRRARGTPDMRAIKRSVTGEVAVAAAVIAVTAMLVNAVPAKTALALPFSTELEAGVLLVDVTIDPAKAGPTDVHVYTLTTAGAVAEVEELTATLALPSQDIAPLEVPLQRAGRGHFAAYGFDVPIRGTWRLTVAVRTNDIEQERASTDVRIR